MLNEIGSEYWDTPIGKKNNFFKENTNWFISGRSALQAIIKELDGVRTAALPSWCCHTMIKPFTDAGIEVCLYPVYPENGIIQEINTDCDILFLMDYFGYTSENTANHPLIIRDVTHSVFSYDYNDADYYFGSLRKWCGVWTGGYAYAKDGHKIQNGANENIEYITLRKNAMERKSCYINGIPDKNGNYVKNKDYLKIYAHAEEILESCGVYPAAERDVELAKMLDIEYVKLRRRANAKILMAALNDFLIFPELKEHECPMFVPVLVPNGKRDELRNYLIDHNIYCPVHWQISEYHKLDKKTAVFYNNELSLVCDQRYNAEDMMKMANIIKKYWSD
ncbi:MAG: hypothetical protein NC452_08815 [Eubacterium sp.]|nr:hypothetical protein [Eubacterium sp.]